MPFGFFTPPAVSAPVTFMPPAVNVLAYKTNGVQGNAIASAGISQVFNSPANNKSNNVSRVSGDLTFQPIWSGNIWDPDYVDTVTPNAGGFF